MKQYFLLSVILIQLISCSKSDETPDPVGPPAVPKILYKMVGLDTTKTAPNDTLGMTIFDYDAQGRISKQVYSTYVPASGIYQFYSSFAFTYNGSDTLASTVMENLSTDISTGPFTIRWKHFLTYDASGQLVADSSHDVTTSGGGTGYDSSVYTIRYIPTPNGYNTMMNTYYPTSGSYPGEAKTIRTDLAGNKISEFKAGGSGFTYQFEYDNHVNPLFRTLPLNIIPMVHAAFPSGMLGGWLDQKHNFSKVYSVAYDALGNLSNPQLRIEYKIIYHENGMPSSIRPVSTPAATNDKYKQVFIYK